MLLSEIVKYSSLTCVSGYDPETEVSGVTSASHKTEKGHIFFALEGTHTDGHLYVKDAAEQGAAALVVSRGRGREFTSLNIPILEADNTRRAFAYALDAFCGYPSSKLRIIAVTGTNGKTSISSMLAHILARAGYKCGLIGTLGCFMGGERVPVQNADPLANMTTPDPSELYPLLSCMVREGMEYIIMEVSSHASALCKTSPLIYTSAVFSNLTPEHLDFHHTMDEYFAAKLDILKGAKRVIANADTPYTERIRRAISDKKLTFVSRLDTKYDFFVENVRTFGVDSMHFTLHEGRKIYNVALNLFGAFNVENASLAFACASELGVPPEICLVALKDFYGAPGRMQRVKTPKSYPASVFIDYAHTPDAIENVLSSLRTQMKKTQRLILLFGCGGDRDKAKRPIMARAAERYADLVTVTSDNPRSERREDIISDIVKGFSEGFSSYTVIVDRKDAIKYTLTCAREGDVILLAGKGHEKYEIDKDGIHPFDEEATVLDCLEGYKK